MKPGNTLMVIILSLSILLAGCGRQELAVQEPVPTQTSSPVPASPEPTESLPEPTPTSSPEPSPSPTSGPALPANLDQITYRTVGQLEPLFQIQLEEVIDLNFSPDHRYLQLRKENSEGNFTDIFIDLEAGQDIFSLVGSHRLYFAADSTLIEVLDEGGVSLVELDTGNALRVYNSRFPAAAMSTTSQILVELESGEGQNAGSVLHFVDLSTAEELYQIYVNAPLEKENLHFDADGELLAGSYLVPPSTYVSTVWNVRLGYPVFTTYGFTEIALHPFGSEAALSNAKQNYISLVSTVTWEQRLYLGPAADGPLYYDLEYAGQGRLIYALVDEETTTPAIWYPPSGERIEFEGDFDLLAMSISPDRELLATSDKRGYVTIWGIPE